MRIYGYRTGIYFALLVVFLSLVFTGGALSARISVFFLTGLGAVLIWELLRSCKASREKESELEIRQRELACMRAVGKEIAFSTEINRIFMVMERECRKILKVDRFSIALFDHETGSLTMSHRYGLDSSPAMGEPLPEICLERMAASEKRPFMIDREDDNVTPAPDLPRFRDNRLRSAMAVPLIVEDRVIGVSVLQAVESGAYDRHSISILSTLCQQIAVVVENARYHRMATVDSLTGFYLRDYFFKRVEEEYNRAKRYHGTFALLMLDLDGFKKVNDRHGHLAADRYLQAVGSRIRSRLRAADLACRFGGDEFCLLLPETDLNGARAIGERLRTAVSEIHLHSDGLDISGTVSVGVAGFPDHDSNDLRGLLRKADQALYRAKKGGKNRVIEFPGPVLRSHGGRPDIINQGPR